MVAIACLFLSAKECECPRRARDVINAGFSLMEGVEPGYLDDLVCLHQGGGRGSLF